jgi:hypothetical protein
MSDGVRHGRQIRLKEVGTAGQDRLDATEAVLSGAHDAREVEAVYLRQAGLKVREAHPSAAARVRAKPDEKLAVETLRALGVRDPAARDVADGALRALIAMRTVLGVTGAKDPIS